MCFISAKWLRWKKYAIHVAMVVTYYAVTPVPVFSTLSVLSHHWRRSQGESGFVQSAKWWKVRSVVLVLLIVGMESGQANLLKFIHQNFITDERGIIVNLFKFICVNADQTKCVFFPLLIWSELLLYSSHFPYKRKDYIGSIQNHCRLLFCKIILSCMLLSWILKVWFMSGMSELEACVQWWNFRFLKRQVIPGLAEWLLPLTASCAPWNWTVWCMPTRQDSHSFWDVHNCLYNIGLQPKYWINYCSICIICI